MAGFTFDSNRFRPNAHLEAVVEKFE